jgi:hypothetical protein
VKLQRAVNKAERLRMSLEIAAGASGVALEDLIEASGLDEGSGVIREGRSDSEDWTVGQETARRLLSSANIQRTLHHLADSLQTVCRLRGELDP